MFSHKILKILSSDWVQAEAGLVYRSYFSFNKEKLSTLKANYSRSIVTARHRLIEE